MIPAPLPPDEEDRLRALHALSVLDTEPEERFERLTRLALRLFKTPFAFVSLIDRDRQWNKSMAGLEVCEVPRSLSFCGHALLADSVFVIPDALDDPRFADNPFVVGEPHIRFYAGSPLRAPNGSRLGSFCVLDRQPRSFSAEDGGLLQDLAAIADAELAAVHLATTDFLTNLVNRRGFHHQGQRLLALCQRNQVLATLMYFDLNDFKAINDRDGHEAGDRVLVAFAELLTQTFRASDLCARLGGDEFVVLYASAQPEFGRAALARLKLAVDQFNVDSGLRAPLAYSVGRFDVAMGQRPNVDELLREADRRMYERKRAMRLDAYEDLDSVP